MKFCCFLFDDDDDHSHIMGTIVTNDIRAIYTRKNKTRPTLDAS